MNIRSASIRSLMLTFMFSASMMLPQLLSTDYFGSITEDAFTYTSWASQFIDTLKGGVIYPRWNPLDFWGYGSPTFVLYSPLAFYMAAIFKLFCGSLIHAMNICKFAAFFLSAVGLFFLVREFYPARTALLSAIFFILLPFNIFELYLTGGFASMVSIAWFPVLVLFICKYAKTRQIMYLIYAGICYAGLILTHLLNAYMFTFVMLFFIIWHTLTARDPHNLISLPVIIVTGLLLSAAYLLPLVYEKTYVSLGTFVEDFRYSDFFFLPNRADRFPPDHTWRYFQKEYAANLIYMVATLAVAIPATTRSGLISYRSDTTNACRFFIGLAATTMFLLIGASSFIWESVPLFKYIQFPFRWLQITAFAIAFLSAAWFHMAENAPAGKRWRGLIIMAPFIVSLMLDSFYISSSHVFPEEKLIPANPVNIALEHLPAGVKPERLDKRYPVSPRAVIIRGSGRVETVTWESTERVMEIGADQPLLIKVRTFNFPGWAASIDGISTRIDTDAGTRAMLINTPAGKHRLRLVFSDTPVRVAGKLITLATATALVIILAVMARTRKQSAVTDSSLDIIDLNCNK